MTKRDIQYCINNPSTLILAPLYLLASGLISKNDGFVKYKGITIAEFGAKEEYPLFVEKTKKALAFLEETDPRRFKRIQRHIKPIVYSNRARASYNHNMTGCFVGFAHFHFEDDAPYKIPWYARTLVHEATHGVFREHKIPYTRRTRERVEYTCVLEEWRSAQRFEDGLDWYDHTWSKTANRAWDPVWNENLIHRAQTIFRPNANGELDSKNCTTSATTLSRTPPAQSDA